MKQSSPSSISIIIPVLNEENHIGRLLSYLNKTASHNNVIEILVVDGGSKDQTVQVAKTGGAKVLHSPKGRAVQMNHGAHYAKGEIFYFLHADTVPPQQFDTYILDAFSEGFKAGCFRMKFDSNSRFLKFFAFLSRVNHRVCRGGDQSLYITKKLFRQSKGFNEDYIIYEDTEFIGRLYKMTNFKVLAPKVITSARKYEQKGAFTLQYHFGVIHLKNLFGAGPDQLYHYYKRKISTR
ncbi:TIGR04283 family arsenosugar biosynthesis glycosyltransferase [Spongiimicrobium sp. 3-5]|uniref:TIGR04283 family arsenosugar biosynthesis glycosyltransferase n=1 Tax=Spongiimicrobium sp. 3-5 TaxID=3332596 RepID=UPI0039801BA1